MKHEYTACPTCTYVLPYADVTPYDGHPDIGETATRNMTRAGHLAPATDYGALQINNQPCDFCGQNIIGEATGWETT